MTTATALHLVTAKHRDTAHTGHSVSYWYTSAEAAESGAEDLRAHGYVCVVRAMPGTCGVCGVGADRCVCGGGQ